MQSKKPAQWSKCDLVPIPKSGNLEEVGNYRELHYLQSSQNNKQDSIKSNSTIY